MTDLLLTIRVKIVNQYPELTIFITVDGETKWTVYISVLFITIYRLYIAEKFLYLK